MTRAKGSTHNASPVLSYLPTRDKVGAKVTVLAIVWTPNTHESREDVCEDS